MASFSHPFLQKIESHDLGLPAFVYENVRYSYADLLECVRAKIIMLDSMPSGSCVGIVGDYDLDSIAFFTSKFRKRQYHRTFYEWQ